MKQVTREAITSAAEAVFAERGFSGARMEDIAERAGVSVGTLYNYFDDRRAILEATLGEAAEELAALLDSEVPPPPTPFDDRLRRFVEIVLGRIEAHFRLYAILIEEELESGRCGQKERRQPVLFRVYQAAERLIASGVEGGTLLPEESGLYASLLVGMMRGLFMRQLRVDDGRRLSAHAPTLVRVFLEGTRARS